MPQAHHYIHAGGPQYAPPLLRAPSPSSSIGTAYGGDETSLSDKELSQEEFERKCEEMLGLHAPREEELWAALEPRLPRPKTALDEKVMLDAIMRSLREKVRRLEEDELFEQTLLRGPQVGQDVTNSSGDIDAILQSLMEPTGSQSTAQFNSKIDIASTPWGSDMPHSLPTIAGSFGSNTTMAGKRSTRANVSGRRL